MIPYQILKKILFLLEPEKAHYLSLESLNLLNKLKLSFLYSANNSINYNNKKLNTEILGIKFPNKLGLAAGLDKNGEYLDCLGKLGFGFIEIGTVTPKPQLGNPKPRLFRLAKDKSIINRMGFNNFGVNYLLNNLNKTKYSGILGVNIGKNYFTDLNNAVNDYIYCLNKLYNKADYVVVNISSPNTKNLRELQTKDSLEDLLSKIKQEQIVLSDKNNKYIPILIKIAPDLSIEELKFIVDKILLHKLDGIVLTNTVKVAEGGLSGKLIESKSTQLLTELRKITYDLPVVSVGGIYSKEVANNRIKLGADLLQLYTGLIYEGPKIVRNIVNSV